MKKEQEIEKIIALKDIEWEKTQEVYRFEDLKEIKVENVKRICIDFQTMENKKEKTYTYKIFDLKEKSNIWGRTEFARKYFWENFDCRLKDELVEKVLDKLKEYIEGQSKDIAEIEKELCSKIK